MRKLRVGVIGLGEVAQVIHLPVIESLPDRFELAAVCDISPGLLERLGDRHRVGHRYTDYRELLAAGGLDCVLVLNSDEYHADCGHHRRCPQDDPGGLPAGHGALHRHHPGPGQGLIAPGPVPGKAQPR